MIHKNILTAFTGLFVASVLVVGSFSLAPLAHAQEDGGDFSGGCCGGSDVVDGYSNYAPSYGSDVIDGYSTSQMSYGSDVIDGYSTSPLSYGSDVVDGYSTYPASYNSGYMTGGYLAGGYSTGGYLAGGYLPSRPSYIPTSAGNTNVNTNTNILNNGNSCTAGNSCNTNIVTTTNYPATPAYNPPVCASGFYGTYPNCYRPTYNPPVAYANPTPYISLSQAPYTGLDLGFWGTIAYWGFLILWCFVAAYLVVVKKVQNRILRSLNTFLFGDYATVATSSLALSGANSAVSTFAPVNTYSELVPTPVDAIDPFIVSQINRVRA